MDAITGTIPSHAQRWHVDGAAVLTSRTLQSPVGDSGVLDDWWADRADEALTTILRLDDSKLLGVTITSQTTRVLRIHSAKFGRLDHASTSRWQPPLG